MNCKETGEVLYGYLDGELDLTRSLALERHLEDCPVCARAHQERQTLRTALAERSLYFEAPKGLERRVRSALRLTRPTAPRADRPRWHWNWRWPVVFAPFAAAAVALLVALPFASHRPLEQQLAAEILSAHVRSLMLDHKTDVASSDQHTVKPWFDGKLDFAPPVFDLAERGFPLVGGRLDYLQGRPVAALVYQRRKHLINVFIWPAASEGNQFEKTNVLRGYNLITWTSSGMTFWAVTDLNRAELDQLIQLIKGR